MSTHGTTAYPVGTTTLEDAILPGSPAARPLEPLDSPYVYRSDAPTHRAKARNHYRLRAFLAGDLLAILCGFAFLAVGSSGVAIGSLALLMALAMPIWIVLNQSLRLYDRDKNLIHKSTLNELPTIIQSSTLGAALLFLVAPAARDVTIGRPEIVGFWVVVTALTVGLRTLARAYVSRALPPERVLIVGSGPDTSLLARKLDAHKEYGVQVVGNLDGSRGGQLAPGTLGDVADFEDICRDHEVERVIVSFSSLDHHNLLDIIRVAKRRQMKISVVPRLYEVTGPSVEIDAVEGMTVLGLRGVSRSRSTLLLKRTVDVVGALGGLLVAAPVMIAAGAAVALTSRGGVFFRQARVGRGHEDFSILKFRTMVADAEELKDSLRAQNEMDGKMFKIADDPRVTRVGRFLRRTSIDELPQLINVLRGEMSLVGPRPLVPDENVNVISWHRARLDITPGLTGPWQVMGRNAIPFDEMVKLDYLYVAEWSLWNDCKLLLRTLPVIFGSRGS